MNERIEYNVMNNGYVSEVIVKEKRIRMNPNKLSDTKRNELFDKNKKKIHEFYLKEMVSTADNLELLNRPKMLAKMRKVMKKYTNTISTWTKKANERKVMQEVLYEYQKISARAANNWIRKNPTWVHSKQLSYFPRVRN